ncbi:MAG: tetratricopeptide repeat protein, partial [Candidatus Latescibacteria bacterium]|nr:tetratricopeptide repeat protein [Candidatus Latescibacterota bacterium]
ALDDWAALRLLKREELAETEAEPLFAVSRLADPDPWRNGLRDAVLGRDAEALRRLAGKADPAELPARSLDMLGVSLGEVDPQAAVGFLKRVQRFHAGDLWTNCHLGFYLSRAERPDHDEVIRFYTAALSISPGNALVRTNLSSALIEAGRLEEARAVLGRGLEIDPESPDLHTNLSVVLSKLGELEEAEAHARRAVELRPKDGGYRANLAAMLQYRGRLEPALEQVRRALELDPDSILALGNKGVILDKLGRSEEAIAVYRDALEIAPRNAGLHEKLAGALRRSGRPAEALETIFRAAELAPDDPDILYKLGTDLNLSKRWEEAIPYFERAIERKPEDPRIRINYGNALSKTGNPTGAEAAYRKAIDIDPSMWLAWDDLGRLLGHLGRTDEAIAALERAMEEAPRAGKPHNSLGALYADDLGDHERAEREFREAVRLEPGLATAWYNLGLMLERRGETEEAVDSYRRASEADPGYFEAYERRSRLHFERGDYREAASACEKALSLARNETERANCRANVATALCNHAVALTRARNHRAAMAAYREAIRVHPDHAPSLNNLAWAYLSCPEESLRDFEEGRRLAERAAALEPESPHSLGTLGLACYRTGDFRRAVEVLERRIPRHGEARAVVFDRLVLSMALFRLDRQEKARRSLAEAARLIEEHGVEDEGVARLRAEAETLILGEGR